MGNCSCSWNERASSWKILHGELVGMSLVNFPDITMSEISYVSRCYDSTCQFKRLCDSPSTPPLIMYIC